MPVLIFFLSIPSEFGDARKFLWTNIFAMRFLVMLIVGSGSLHPQPDATTMLIFMAPMIGLYFVGMRLRSGGAKKNRQLAAEAAGKAQ